MKLPSGEMSNASTSHFSVGPRGVNAPVFISIVPSRWKSEPSSEVTHNVPSGANSAPPIATSFRWSPIGVIWPLAKSSDDISTLVTDRYCETMAVFLSGAKSEIAQPPPCTCATILLVDGSRGFMTYRSLSVPLRRVELYATSSPSWLQALNALRLFPSVSKSSLPSLSAYN